MGMMNAIRDRTHLILWGLLLLFLGSMTVGGMVGGADIVNRLFGRVSPAEAVAVVNGEYITPDEFNALVQSRLEEARQEGQEVDDRRLGQIRQSVLDDLIQNELVSQEIARHGITVSDAEIYYYLKNNPPSFLQGIEQFQTDSTFDPSKYQQALANPQGDEWKQIEDYLRTYLPRTKLQNRMRSGVRVSEVEVRREYVRKNVPHTISAILFPTSAFPIDSLKPTEQEIIAYHAGHQDEFVRKAARQMRVVRWDKVAGAEDSLAVQQEAEELAARARAGEDFAALADEFSDDPSNAPQGGKKRGGDLNWFGRGQMVPEFEEAVLKARKGSIVGPVRTSFGYHVIHVRDRRIREGKAETLASHILLKVETGPETVARILDRAQQFVFDTEDLGFDSAATAAGLAPQTLPPVPEDAVFLPGFGFFPAPVRFAFEAKLRQVSEVLETERAVAVFVLDSLVEEGTQPLEQVRTQIERKLASERQMEKSKTLSDEARGRLLAGETFARIKESVPEALVIESSEVNLSGAIPQIGRAPALAAALQESAPGNFLPPIKSPRGYVVARLEKPAMIDEADWEIKRAGIRSQMLGSRQNQITNEWLKELKEKAKIIDNRKYYL